MKKTNWKKIGYEALKGGGQILAAFAFLVLLWWAAYLLADNELVVPALSDCAKQAWRMLGKAWFWQAFSRTFFRVLVSFFLSFVLAAVFAVISYLLPAFAKFFAPIVAALRSLPVLAVSLILIIWFGAGGAPIVVAFLSLFPMLYTGIFAALSSVDKQLIDVGRACGVTVKNNVFRVYVPLAAPYVTREATAAFSFALKLVVSAEVVANTARSLGGLMQEAQGYLELPKLFALVIVTFFVALVLETVGNWLSKRVESALK